MLVCAETLHSVLQQLDSQLKSSVAAIPSDVQLACGLSGSVAVGEGTTAVVRSILRRYMPRISSDSWLHVCACMSRMVQAALCEGGHHAQRHNLGQGWQPSAAGSSAQGRSLAGVLVAVAHAIGSAIHAELHACEYRRKAQKGEPRRKEAALRLQQLSHYRAVSKVLIYDECALLARQLELELTAAAAPTFEQVRNPSRFASLECRFQQPNALDLCQLWGE